MNYISDLYDYSFDDSDQIKEYLTPQRKAGIKKEIEQIVDDQLNAIEEHCTGFISQTAAERAKRFLWKVLNGDKDAAMELLDCQNGNSRYRNAGGDPWAQLIHGTLFETDPIKLRRKIVSAHADLIASERIKDLESIVEGLSLQVRKLERQLNDCRDQI